MSQDASACVVVCGDGLVTCVEWGSRVEAGLPADRIVIRIEVKDESRRTFECVAHGPGAAAVLTRWSEESP